MSDIPSSRLVADSQLRWRERWTERALAGRENHVPAAAIATGQGFVLTREQATVGAGMSRAVLRRRLSSTWSSPLRGVYAIVKPIDGRDADAIGATAAALRLGRDVVVSGRSAAVLHGLPTWGRPEPTVTVPLRRGDATSTRLASARVLHADLPADQRIRWFGVAVTTAARTVIDMGRGSLRGGLIAADAALAGGLVTRAELELCARSCGGWPGIVGARRAVELARAKSESPLETLLRLCLVDAALPEPKLQVVIMLGDSQARVDMFYRDAGLVIEADGMSKYTDIADLRAEKIRQERLEAAGMRVIRFVWDDVMNHPERTAARVRTALSPHFHPAFAIAATRIRPKIATQL